MLYSDYHIFGFILTELQARIREAGGLFRRSKHSTDIEVELCTFKKPISGNGIVGAGTDRRNP